MVYQLAYVSSAVGEVHRTVLNDILTTARARNHAGNISGMLLYRDGRFFQLLEGSAPAVGMVFRSILADPRHRGVRCVWTAHSADRAFTAWSMGFRDLTDHPLSHPAYLNLLHDDALSAMGPSVVHELWALLRPASTPPPPAPAQARESALPGLAAYVRRGLEQIDRGRPSQAGLTG